MESKNIQTVLAYLRAVERGDRQAIRACLGKGYKWIDRTLEANAHSPMDLAEETAEFNAWSDVHYEVKRVVDMADGSVFTHILRSGTLNGKWRSLVGREQQVRYLLWDIFGFDTEGRIVSEEGYYDLASVRRQLGYE